MDEERLTPTRGNGVWITGDSLTDVALLAALPFDYLCVDLQHGLFDPRRIADVARVLRASGTRLAVRVPWNRPEHIMYALDSGAADVVVPMVDTAEQASAAVAAGHYPPAGVRSWGPMLPESTMSAQEADGRTGVFVMVETARSLANLEDIASTPGLSGIYVGPNDLALSLGEGRSTYRQNRRIADALDTVATVCARHAIVSGVHCSDPEMAAEWGRRGFGMRTVATDTSLLMSAASAALTASTGADVSAPGGY